MISNKKFKIYSQQCLKYLITHKMYGACLKINDNESLYNRIKEVEVDSELKIQKTS